MANKKFVARYGIDGIDDNQSITNVTDLTLNSITETLHRSPNAIISLSIYDTTKDSDGGAWTEKCQHTSWYNETVYGKWLGAQPSELYARCVAPSLGDTLISNGDFAGGSSGWVSTANWTITNKATCNGSAGELYREGSEAYSAGDIYEVTFTITGYTSGSIYPRLIGGTTVNGTSVSANGSYTQYLTAASGNINLRMFPTGGFVGSVDNIAVKKVTQTTAAEDYFQLTTDGKFYKLNAGSGTTEIFRGNKRSFPKLAAIVAEAASVTIYDLTEPGRPMCARYPNTGAMATGNIAALAAINGRIFVGGASGLSTLNFITDRLMLRNTTNLRAQSGLATIRTAALSVESGAVLTNAAIAAISVTVMPDAPLDPVTGLKVPTIAVATGGGISVIKHNGTIVTGSILVAFTNVTINKNILTADRSNVKTLYFALNPSALASSFSFDYTSTLGNFTYSAGFLHSIRAKNILIERPWASNYISLLEHNESTTSKSLTASLSDTYNTGWLCGDIRRAYLASNMAGTVGPSTELVTNGTFDTDTTGWSAYDSAVLSVNNGAMRLTNTIATYGSARAAINTVVGSSYLFKARTVARIAGAAYRVRIGTSSNQSSAGIVATLVNNSTTEGVFSTVFTSTSATLYVWVVCSNGASDWVEVDDISVREIIADRSYKSVVATIYGTLTAAAVNTGNDLVAYSGFSGANYLQEPYSADLDFGTGEWSASAWVNVPTSLPETNFPVVGGELLSNPGNPFIDTTGWTSFGGLGTLSVVNSKMRYDATGISGSPRISATVTTVVGKSYKIVCSVSVTSGSGSYLATSFGSAASNMIPIGGNGVCTLFFTATSTTSTIYGYFSGTGGVADWDYFSVKEASLAIITDRSYSTGAKLQLGVTGAGSLTATAYDGTTTRTVTTTAAYNTATWTKVRANYTTDGTLSLWVNGQQVAATYGNPLLTLNNASAVLTIGNSYALDAPFPGSIALLKFSATVPTAEQALFMYEQEKALFNAGAKCVLPTNTNVLDLAYDDATDMWSALQATYESTWSGLVRTNTQPPSAGSFVKTYAGSGVKLLSRSTTNPGVDVQIPVKNLRQKESPTISKEIISFDYVGGFTATTSNGNTYITSVSGVSIPSGISLIGSTISGSGISNTTKILNINSTTYYMSNTANTSASGVQISIVDFPLPLGYTTTSVILSGTYKQEGTTKDWVRIYDGFKEIVRFNTPPAYNAWIQIQANRS